MLSVVSKRCEDMNVWSALLGNLTADFWGNILGTALITLLLVPSWIYDVVGGKKEQLDTVRPAVFKPISTPETSFEDVSYNKIGSTWEIVNIP